MFFTLNIRWHILDVSHFVNCCPLCFTGLFLPAVVRPILDSMETSKQVSQPALNDVSTNCSTLFCYTCNSRYMVLVALFLFNLQHSF